jgi:hypothetical protein
MMFGLPEAPKFDFNKMAAQEKAHRKADWIERAAVAWFHAARDEVCVQYFADIYDEIQKFRNIESA